MNMDRRWFWLGGGLVLALALAYHFVWLATLPPGLDRDAAANGWMALNWLRYGLVPFWMPHASAPEPLIVWLQTALTAGLGPSVAALRSASALFLALAALVVYALTLEVAKPFAARQRWWAALLAGIIFACNPVVTQLARTGLRASTLPLLSGLFFLCLLGAWRSNARRHYLLSGLVLGIAAYTYLAARFLPIVLLLFVLFALWNDSRTRHSASHPGRSEESPSAPPPPLWARIRDLLLMALVALIVITPQLIFFAIYPTAFFERAQSVSLFANPALHEMGLARLLLAKVVALFLSLGVEWSGQYNQAARPLLSPLPFVGLLLAIPLVIRWRRRPAMLLTVIALLVMLLPDLIGGDRLQPHELRVIGAYVPMIVLSGIGLAFGLELLIRFVKSRATLNIAGALLALLLAGWGIVDWFGLAAPLLAQSDYTWYARPDVALTDAINGSDQPMLVPLNDYSRSVVAYLAAQRIHHLRSGIDLRGQMVTPSSEQVLLLWPAAPERTRVESSSYRFDPQSLVLIDGDHAYLLPPAQADVAHLQSACGAQPLSTPAGEAAGALCAVDFTQFDFPSQVLPSLWSSNDRYDEVNGKALRLHGISAGNDRLVGGTTLGVTSYWQAEAPASKRWRYFVHLLDDQQTLVAGDDLIPGYGVYETQLWQPDELVPVRQALQLPANLAPGRYWLEVGLYNPLTGKRAVISGTGADHTLVGPLKAPLLETAVMTSPIVLPARFGDEIALDAYQLTEGNNELQVSLRLAALRPPQRDYTVFIHVEDSAGALIAQRDAQPLDGHYPTAIWEAGEAVVSVWNVTLPTTLAAGSYRIWLGLYDAQSGQRLAVQSAAATVDQDRLLVSEIELDPGE